MIRCYDAMHRLFTVAPDPASLSTRGFSLGLHADNGPYRDAFACGLEPRAFPLHRNPDHIPVFLCPILLRVRVAITITP